MRLLLFLVAVAGCAHPAWCESDHCGPFAGEPVYKRGRRCAVGQPVKDWDGEDVIYVDSCDICARE